MLSGRGLEGGMHGKGFLRGLLIFWGYEIQIKRTSGRIIHLPDYLFLLKTISAKSEVSGSQIERVVASKDYMGST